MQETENSNKFKTFSIIIDMKRVREEIKKEEDDL
jgi:hypothetical protein